MKRNVVFQRIKGLIKDFGGLVIACFALVLSMFNFYDARHVVDDLRFTIGNDRNIPNPDSGHKQFILYGPHLLTFINSGNRSVALLNVSLAFFQSKEDKAGECPEDSSEIVAAGIDPFVIKPSEILVKKVQYTDKAVRNAEGNVVIRMKDDVQRIVSCFVFDIVTPDNVQATVTVPVSSSEFSTPPYGSSDAYYFFRPMKIFPR
jgi:hypothetical protein